MKKKARQEIFAPGTPGAWNSTMPVPPVRLPRGARAAVNDALLPWFSEHARDLPWRQNRTPYRVWVSELMLQQTRVETVVPYFNRWMRRFPDVNHLADAPLQDVLKLWEGLGYYARARNLHRAANWIVEELDAVFPSSEADLKNLPGVGSYTAAAVASLAFGEPAAVVDGNVERVLSRLCSWDADVRKTATKAGMRILAQRLLPVEAPGAFNEAMMELGATVCMPRNPLCTACPMQDCCRARKQGRQDSLPVKTKKAAIPTIRVGAALTRRESDGRYLIAQRLEKGMLGGMWEFPGGKLEEGESMSDCIQRELQEELGIRVDVGKRFMKVRHTYSHFHLDMDVHHAQWQGDEPQTLDCAAFAWASVPEMREYPFGGADLKVISRMESA